MAVPAPGGRRSWRLPLPVIAVAVVAALLGLLVWRLVTQGRGSHLVATVAQGKHPAAPGFVLRSIWPHTETWPAAVRPVLDDGRLALSELRGYPVVLNFWASWCVPCKAEAPRFAASARAHAGKVAFVGVDIQDFTGDARRFLRRVRSNYVTVRDGGDATYSRYGLTGVPETYFVDRRGRIAAHSIGEISRRELERGVAAASRDTTMASGPPPGPYRGSQPPPGIQAPDFE
ncbi:MAG: TlpA family protein disulfide reductase, partial [Gaiellaceae bacterium]